MTQDIHLQLVHKTGSSRTKEEDAIGCEYNHIEVDGWYIGIRCTVCIDRTVQNPFRAACYGKHPRSTKAFISRVCNIRHHDVVSSGIVVHSMYEKPPQEWTKQALITFEEVPEAYKVETFADSPGLTVCLTSCRYLTCLLLG
jgi:hypothetical protein